MNYYITHDDKVVLEFDSIEESLFIKNYLDFILENHKEVGEKWIELNSDNQSTRRAVDLAIDITKQIQKQARNPIHIQSYNLTIKP